MCYRSISRWYRLIIIVISIHPQFHLHTQHKQFTPENFIRMEFTRKRRAKNKKRHTKWLFTSIQHIREQYWACLSKRWTYITVINAIHAVYQCCHWTAGENHLHSRQKKSKNRLLALLHSCSIHWSVQLWGFNFLLFDSHCFFPFSVVCKLHWTIIRREPRFWWNTFVFLFIFYHKRKNTPKFHTWFKWKFLLLCPIHCNPIQWQRKRNSAENKIACSISPVLMQIGINI